MRARSEKTQDQILTDEYTLDPLGRNYASMTDQQATDDINSDYRFTNAEESSGAYLHDSVDPDEEAALADSAPSAQDELFRVYSLGERIPIGPNTRVRRFLIETFPNGTASYDALIETFRDTITRAHELGLPTIKLGWTQRTKP